MKSQNDSLRTLSRGGGGGVWIEQLANLHMNCTQQRGKLAGEGVIVWNEVWRMGAEESDGGGARTCPLE